MLDHYIKEGYVPYVFTKIVLNEAVEITFHPSDMMFTAYYDGQTWRMDKWESSVYNNPVMLYIMEKKKNGTQIS